NRDLVARIEAIALEIGCTQAQLVLAWLLAQGDDVIPIPGTKRLARLEENLGALKVQLGADDIARITDAIPPGAAAGTRYPVAEPVIYCAEDSVVGTAFYVMGYADGRVIWEPHMPGVSPAERAGVYDTMNATLARLHSFDPAAIGLSDFGRGENYVARQVDRWSKQYRASETETIEEMERLIAWLPLNLPPPAPVRLVHGDYRLDNIIRTPSQPKIL